MPDVRKLSEGTDIYRQKAIRLFNRAMEIFRVKRKKRKVDLLAQLLTALYKFFGTMGRPTLTKKRKINIFEPPSSAKYNDTHRELDTDLDVAFAQQNAIDEAVVLHYNYEETERQRLYNMLSGVDIVVEDYGILNKSYDIDKIRFGDHFLDKGKIDTEYPLGGNPLANIDPTSKTATLARRSAVNLLRDADISKQVYINATYEEKTLTSTIMGALKAVGDFLKSIDTGFAKKMESKKEDFLKDNDCLYQGKMYGVFTGKADTGEDGIHINIDNVMDAAAARGQLGEFTPQAMEPHPGFSTLQAVIDRTPDGRGGVPNTYWEYECVQRYANIPNPITEEIGIKNAGDIKYDYHQDPTNTISSLELIIDITILFRQPKMLSGITISPHLFAKTNLPRIDWLKTAKDGAGSEWEDVRITKRDTDSYSTGTVSLSSAGGASSAVYLRSTSAWMFPSRRVYGIKFRLAQPRPYGLKYSMAVLKSVETTTETATGIKAVFRWITGGNDPKVVGTRDIFVVKDVGGKEVMKKAEEDLASAIEEAQQALEESTGTTRHQAAETLAIVSGTLGFLGGPVGAILGATIGALIGWAFGDKTDVTYSDFQVDETFGENGYMTVESTVSNRKRWAIGVSDVSAYNFPYTKTAEFVSKEYISPKPIKTLALDANEVDLPKDIFGARQDWIKYYLLIEGSDEQVRILPRHKDENRNFFTDGRMIPKTISVNSTMSNDGREAHVSGHHAFADRDGPVYKFRLRVVFERPATTELDDFHSPILKSYTVLASSKEVEIT